MVGGRVGSALLTIIKVSALYMVFVMAMALTGPLLSNAVYGYITGDWSYLVNYGITLVAGYIFVSAETAVTTGLTLGQAALAIAAKLTPWGWAVLGGIAVGL